MMWRRRRRRGDQAAQERLEAAEKELEYLKARAWAVEKRLTDQSRRDDWSQSIGRIIRGRP